MAPRANRAFHHFTRWWHLVQSNIPGSRWSVSKSWLTGMLNWLVKQPPNQPYNLSVWTFSYPFLTCIRYIVGHCQSVVMSDVLRWMHDCLLEDVPCSQTEQSTTNTKQILHACYSVRLQRKSSILWWIVLYKVNGSEAMTVRCVTHHGHCLDGTRLVASHRGRDWASTMYIP